MRMLKTLRISTLLLLASLITLGSCVNYRKLEVASFRCGMPTVKGFTAASIPASVEIYNPSCAFSVYDASLTLYRAGKEYCRADILPVDVAAKSRARYQLHADAAVSKGVSVLEVLNLLGGFRPEEFTVDVSFKLKPKGGIVKEFEFKNVPVQYVADMLKQQIL